MAIAEQTYTLDQERASLVTDFFKTFLIHVKAEWSGEAFSLFPWQEEYLSTLFGWVRGDGTRKYRKSYLEIPRKNGKSSMVAGIALYLLLCDKEPGAEIYSAAADKEQASIVFSIAKAMVEGNPVLSKLCKVWKKVIEVPSTNSIYKPLSRDAYTKHGLNAHGIIFDELHAQPDQELWDVLCTSVGSRRQPLIVAITTAGFDRESMCYEEYTYAKNIIEGIVEDPEYLPWIYELDPDVDDWKDPEVWARVNPSYPITPKAEYLMSAFRTAQKSLADQNTFRRLHLNEWTEQEVRYIDMDLWRAQPKRKPLEELEGRPCYIAADLANVSDTNAVSMLFPPEEDDPEDKVFQLFTYFWLPEATIKDDPNSRRYYKRWKANGLIYSIPGKTTDQDYIQKFIQDQVEIYNVKTIAVDPWNASQLITRLELQDLPVLAYRQGFASLTAPSKELIRILSRFTLAHGHSPILNWQANNAAVQEDPAGNIKPAKDKSSGKIDGIVTTVMAIGCYMVDKEEESRYNRGEDMEFVD